MRLITERYNLLFAGFFIMMLLPCALFSQDKEVLQYLNLFVGTDDAKTPASWGSEGGTYPGAAAPFGAVQITPETRNGDSKGYNYRDSSILYFTCTQHMSGYPNGSSGRIRIMPLEESPQFHPGISGRRFLHQDEKAEAGYYRVLFRDNGTSVEASASGRTGMILISFPSKVKPKLYIGDIGQIKTESNRIIQGSAFNTMILFSRDFAEKEDVDGGCIVTFPAGGDSNNTVIMKIGISDVDHESSGKNLEKEAPAWDFSQFKEKTQRDWCELLSKVEVNDSSRINKTIFYTALYHSLLLPVVISDTEGFYKSTDGKVYRTKGKQQYGGFSPWDTFRTLHPLLCLIAPERQNDMILSVLDQFEQTGKLPKGPMTGNHIIPVIVDSYMKGIRGFNRELAYRAMKEALISFPAQSDFAAYRTFGYVPYSFSESVTKTVEYAYNDWALAQFAAQIPGQLSECRKWLDYSRNYRNLFHTGSGFLIPRMGDDYLEQPGNFGYKEGDKWSYSMFVPHNPRDLINLMGGDLAFSSLLDSAFDNRYIPFDNEPVLHVPYLFNYTEFPHKTQQRVRTLMQTHYDASAGGLPGNDDLGSMSSWYVFSAMGFFPFCPGRPYYEIGSPIFKEVTLHLQNGKKFVITTQSNDADHCYIKGLTLNGRQYRKLWLSHSTITDGGKLSFVMDTIPAPSGHFDFDLNNRSETKTASVIRVDHFSLSRTIVGPDEPFWVSYTLSNSGSAGTKAVRLNVNGKEYAQKNVLLGEGVTINDSLECRLYPVGEHKIGIDHLTEKRVRVDMKNRTGRIEVTGIVCEPVFRKGVSTGYTYQVMNKGGYPDRTAFKVFVNDSLINEDLVVVDPGETRKVDHRIKMNSEGIHRLRAGGSSVRFKVYDENRQSDVIRISAGSESVSDTIYDRSGLMNHGVRFPDCNAVIPDTSRYFITFKPNRSLDHLQDKLTVMAWVFPVRRRGLSDILSKGDFIVFQESDNKVLTFFAGGWGRGTLSVPLPDDWINHWHHIAGISDGNKLKIFIDGNEAGSLTIPSPAKLSSTARWMVGRNEEFPDQRFFNGRVDHFKVFVEALSQSEIREEMKENGPMPNRAEHEYDN
ncbi:MAG: GH92 family glycosyl hydrolase [Prolixibacteraceae bacterium]